MYNKILMSSIVDPDPRTRIEENSIFFLQLKIWKSKLCFLLMLFISLLYIYNIYKYKDIYIILLYFWLFFLRYPDPFSHFTIRSRIRLNDTDPTGSGSTKLLIGRNIGIWKMGLPVIFLLFFLFCCKYGQYVIYM